MLKEFSENFNMKKDIETIINKNTHTFRNEKKSKCEIKNTQERIKSGVDEAENLISNLENSVAENIQSKLQKENIIFKKEDSLRDLWDNMKCNNIPIIGVP